jgi:hypothetical protein
MLLSLAERRLGVAERLARCVRGNASYRNAPDHYEEATVI